MPVDRRVPAPGAGAPRAEGSRLSFLLATTRERAGSSAPDPVRLESLVQRMLRRRSLDVARRRASTCLLLLLALLHVSGLIEHRSGVLEPRPLWAEIALFDALLLASAALAQTRETVGFQLYTRTVLVARLTTLLLVPTQLPVIGVAIVLLSAAALVLLGRDRLDADGGPFVPIHFRGTLLTAIVINGSLALVGIHRIAERLPSTLTDPSLPRPVGLVVTVTALLIGAVGLYRLQTVALAISAVAGLAGLVRALQGVSVALGSPRFTDILRPDLVFTSVASAALILSIIPIVWGIFRLRRDSSAA